MEPLITPLQGMGFSNQLADMSKKRMENLLIFQANLEIYDWV